MALFPRIQSPCPYKNNLAAVMDGDMCRMCKRRVVDITAMSDGARIAFLEGCNGAEVCVSYRIRPALAAAVVAAAIAVPAAAAACPESDEWVIVGGIKNTKHVQYVQYDPADRAVPEIPVIYETSPAAKAPEKGTTLNSPAAP